MKQYFLKEELVKNYHEALLYAYVFLNSKLLNNPEASLLNEDDNLEPPSKYLFSKSSFSFTCGGPHGEIPTWDEFNSKLKNNENMFLICVAGCDEKDLDRITLTVLPPIAISNDQSLKYIFFSISENIENKLIDKIMKDLKSNYQVYKVNYLK